LGTPRQAEALINLMDAVGNYGQSLKNLKKCELSGGGMTLATSTVSKQPLCHIETDTVMTAGEIGQLTAADTNGSVARHDATTNVGGSRALVALTHPPAREAVAGRANARFLAQLLAVKDGHPQTRERRRVTADEAIAAYRSVAALSLH